MSGSETRTGEGPPLVDPPQLGTNLVGTIRSLLIAGMMACVVVSLVGVVQRVAPYWPGQYLALLAFVVCLEGIATERLLKGYSLGSGTRLQVRVVEWVLILVVLRLVLSLLGGWASLAGDVSRWLADPGAIFDAAYLTTALILLIVWQTSISLANDLLLLETSAYVEPAPPTTSDRFWIWITRPKDRADTQAAMRHLSSVFSGGGVLLLIFTGLAHLDLQLLVRLEHPSTSGIVLTALVYFILGLALLSQAQFSSLHYQWQFDGIEVSPRIAPRWAVLGIASVAAVALVALLLPTGYSVGLLQALYVALIGIFDVVVRFLMGILSAILLVLTYILQFFFGSDVAPQAPSIPSPPPRLPEPAPTTAEGVAWLDLLRTAFFWVLLVWIVGYSFYQYFRQRSDLWSKLKGVGLLTWFVGLWRAFFQGSRQVVAKAREGLRAAIKWIGPRIAPSLLRKRFLSLRSLTKRELVRYFYLSTVRRAGEVGWRRKLSQTPYEYQEALAEEAPASEVDVAVLTQAFVEARYDVREFSPEETHVVKQAWQRVRTLLRRARRDRDKSGSSDQSERPPRFP
ncbi:MAG: DUF4129 domain-containing protein [Chloroflexota bacterium]